ncbi:MAG: DUF480 domain-containing protein, partial [Opitutales bacterium]
RDPVVSYTEEEVGRALDRLRDKRLAAVVSGGENRVSKYRHLAAETLELPRPALSLLDVLLLRGAQTPGELRSRTARMHPFADLADVLAGLGALASRPAPLVAVLPRQPGTKESRYVQLLGGKADISAAGPIPTPALPPAEQEPRTSLETELAQVKRELAELRAQFAEFRKQFE